jgi:perosamine synthetase
MAELTSMGVGTQVHYIPIHTQPYYRNVFGYGAGLCPVAEAYYEKALSIPLYPRMEDGEVAQVAGCVKALKTK